jgi:hypothetical protein
VYGVRAHATTTCIIKTAMIDALTHDDSPVELTRRCIEEIRVERRRLLLCLFRIKSIVPARHVREREGLTVASALREPPCSDAHSQLSATSKNSAMHDPHFAHHNKFA